ncbi:MAG TPA: ATP-binding cassette domain-containing protein [Actinocrinis sp.]
MTGLLDQKATPEGLDSILELESITKSFQLGAQEVVAVDDVSLDIAAGEVVALIGPSGCGKTTIMRMCAGFDFPTEGRAVFEGGPIDRVNTGVGYLTQEADLFPWMTLAQNVEFPLRILGVPKAERDRRVAAYLELVGLSGFEDHYPRQLSGGMRQRGALARTMIYEPNLILMDEPFASLDTPTRLMLHDELLRLLAERPKTVVLVTHDITEAIALADRVVVIGRRPGRVKAIIDIDLPRPRTSTGIVNLEGYKDVYNRVWAGLQREFVEGDDTDGAAVRRELPPPLGAPRKRRDRPAADRRSPDERASPAPTASAAAFKPSDKDATTARRRPRRRLTDSAVFIASCRLLFVAAVLGLWQLLSSTKVLSPLLFSAPSGVFSALWDLIKGDTVFGTTVYTNLATTLQEMALGYVVGAAAGVLCGFVLGRTQWLARVFEPLILAAYSVPKVALAPVFIVLLGIGTRSKVAIVGLELFFIVFFNAFVGVRDVKEDFVRQAAINGAGRLSILRNVILPSALPSIMMGLKLGVPFAMIGAVIGEFIAASNGLGWFVINAANNFDSAQLFAGLIVLLIVVWVLSQAMQVVERVAVPWTGTRQRSARSRPAGR